MNNPVNFNDPSGHERQRNNPCRGAESGFQCHRQIRLAREKENIRQDKIAKQLGFKDLLSFQNEIHETLGAGGKSQYSPDFSGPTDDIPSWLEWLGGIKLIWRNAPSFLNFIWDKGGANGTRIFTIDAPHKFAEFWHINSDLKILQFMNHANIEPVLKFFGGIKAPMIIVPVKPFFDFFEKQRPIIT
jgi:hypothetical protein